MLISTSALSVLGVLHKRLFCWSELHDWGKRCDIYLGCGKSGVFNSLYPDLKSMLKRSPDVGNIDL